MLMSVRHLAALLNPASVSVIDTASCVPVPPAAPALAVLRVPYDDWPAAIARVGTAGGRAVVLAAAAELAFRPAVRAAASAAQVQAALAAARPSLLRVLGPGDAALLIPRLGVQIGFATPDAVVPRRPEVCQVRTGRVAWVSQSGATARSALRFAAARALGFSTVVALGDEADIDCADLLDYLASDPYTAAVVLAIDHVKDARKFMSAARACVRNKPVLIWCQPAPGENETAYAAAFERAALLRMPGLDALLEGLAALQASPHADSALMSRYRAAREWLAHTPPAQASDTFDHPGASALLAAVSAAAAGGPRGAAVALSAAQAERLLACFGLGSRAPTRVSAATGAEPSTLTVELHDDPTFGPFLVLSTPGAQPRGALLPLNPALAQNALAQLTPSRPWGETECLTLASALACLSSMLCLLERICAFSATLDPACAPLACQALRIELAPLEAAAPRRPLAIRPYPIELCEQVDWQGQPLTIRPIRPEDEAAHAAFFRSLTPYDLRLRFFDTVRQPDHTQLARYVQIDYEREMALVACTSGADGETVIHGVVRTVTDPDNDTAEFALTIASAEQRRGLGRLLLPRMIDYCRRRGTRSLRGDVLHENTGMLALARACGFSAQAGEDPTVTSVELPLHPLTT
jgi:RimJ/RimL family protein N-acetyltransferase